MGLSGSSSKGDAKRKIVERLLEKLDNKTVRVDLNKYSGKWFEIVVVTDFINVVPERFVLQNVRSEFRISASSSETTKVQMINSGEHRTNNRRIQEEILCEADVSSENNAILSFTRNPMTWTGSALFMSHEQSQFYCILGTYNEESQPAEEEDEYFYSVVTSDLRDTVWILSRSNKIFDYSRIDAIVNDVIQKHKFVARLFQKNKKNILKYTRHDRFRESHGKRY
jgi:lipocalin